MNPDFLLNLLTSFLGSGAALTVAKILIDLRQERQKRRDETGYLALQIAVLLEGYAIECASSASDQQIDTDSGGSAGERLSRVPKFPELPKSDGYKFFDTDLLNSVLDFPQRCEIANKAAIFSMNVGCDDDGKTIEENTLRMGESALRLALRIRQKHRLEPRDLRFGDWDIEDYFREQIKRVTERHSLVAKYNAAIAARQT